MDLLAYERRLGGVLIDSDVLVINLAFAIIVILVTLFMVHPSRHSRHPPRSRHSPLPLRPRHCPHNFS